MTDDVRKILDAARADLLVREVGGENRGFEVETILASVGLPPGQPWCAAFVYWIGRFALGKRWPLPATGSCALLGSYAREKGMLVEQPGPGDVFLLWSATKNRFHHTGFVVEALPHASYRTLEGNTNDDGSVNGNGVYERTRGIGEKDRFIRWQGFVPEGR